MLGTLLKIVTGGTGWQGVALAAGLAALIAAGGAFTAAWAWQGDRWAADIATRAAAGATALAEANLRTLEAERSAQAAARALEDSYVQMSELRNARSLEIGRLRGQLDNAVERLRRVGTGGNGAAGVPGTTAAACGCEELRATRDKLADALGRLVEGGGTIVDDGQRAVDAATLAAAAARAAGAVNSPARAASQTVKEVTP